MPFGAHRDAVGDRDGVEFHRRRAGGANAGLDVLGQRPQMEIAGTDFDPGVGDADERLLQIRVGESGALQHRARGRAARAGRQRIVCRCALTRASRRNRARRLSPRPACSWDTNRAPAPSARTRPDAPAPARTPHRRSPRQIDVEQVFPLAIRDRPRLELRQVDAAQRKHADRLEQRARLVGQREDDARLVRRRARQRPAADDEKARRVVLVVLNRRLERDEAEDFGRARRRDRRRVLELLVGNHLGAAGRVVGRRDFDARSASAGSDRTAPAPADASRSASPARACGPAAPAGGAPPAPRARRRSAARARAAGRNCDECCRRSSSRSAARRSRPSPPSTAAKTSSKLLQGTRCASAATCREAASLNAPGSP